jgi:hypothetical protein
LRALAELEAASRLDAGAAANTALAATKVAVTAAQENIGYPYPPATSSPPKTQGTSAAANLSNAVRSLMTARDQLTAANAGPGPGPARGRGRAAANAAAAAAMTRCLAAISEALAALR